MSLSRLQICVPLLYRNITLRILLASAIAKVLIGIPDMVDLRHYWRTTDWLRCMAPFAIILHHALRLWPRRWWLDICEVLASLLEVVIVGYCFGPLVRDESLHHETGAAASFDLLNEAPSLAMMVSCFISFLFLSCDILSNHEAIIRRPYDYSAGLHRSGNQWSFIFGKFTIRKRFSTDNLLIRCVRGGFAILCLWGFLCLVFYASIWQPLQWSDRPGAKVFKVPIVPGLFLYTLNNIMGTEMEEWPLQAILANPSVPVFNQHPAINVNLTRSSHFPHQSVKSQHPYPYCDHPLIQGAAVLASCSVPLPGTSYVVTEILLTIDFSGVPGNFQVYLGLSQTADTIKDILAAAEPVGIGPGLNLHGLSSISVKERFSDQGAATIGIPKYRQLAVMNLRALSPDQVPSLPRDNNTATLRITVQEQLDIEIEREYLEGSTLNGLALVGGIWTFVNGAFAAIFGSTLLLVLFGIKPLSIYGLIHFFRPGRGSLVDGDYILSPRERDRIIGILKEHLLDVDDAEGDGTSSSRYNPIGVLPQFSRSQCDVGVQT